MFKSNGGFTLVELVVVIAILGILAAFVAPNYTKYITAAENAVASYSAEAASLDAELENYASYIDTTPRGE